MIQPMLDGKIAMITGGGGRIGQAAAQLFARHSATVVIADIVDGEAVAQEICEADGAATFRKADGTQGAQVEALVSEIQMDRGSAPLTARPVSPPKADAMSEGSPAPFPDAAETAQLLGLMRGFVVAKTVHVVATLGVADRLAAGPLPNDEIARLVDANPDALYRILRALASIGLFEEGAGRSFALTRLGHRLRSDVPGSLRHWFLTNGGLIYQAFTGAVHSARTGGPAFDHVFGASFFDYLRHHLDESTIFSTAMREYTSQANTSLLASYDFAGVRQVVDVGGGPNCQHAVRHSAPRAKTDESRELSTEEGGESGAGVMRFFRESSGS